MKRFFKRKQTNNKGFSLVELIISFALLGVVAIGVFMVMSAGSNMFTNVDRQINIQYKSQTAMAQFQQYFMGCSKGITKYDNNIVYFADGSTVYAFKFVPDSGSSDDDTDKKIYFASFSYETAEADIAYQPFCSDVEAFTVDVVSSGQAARSVKVTFTISDSNGKSYTASQLFSFRNKPVYVSAPSGDLSLYNTFIGTLNGTLDDND